MAVVVEKMRCADIAGLIEIEKASFAHPWSEENFEAELEKGSSVFLVAKYGEKAVGYIGFDTVLDEGYTYNVAVLPEYRRQGIADLLLSAALDMCRELKLAFLSLEVRETNEPAISLYKKHGFETVGKRRDFYTAPKEDALIMTAYLNS